MEAERRGCRLYGRRDGCEHRPGVAVSLHQTPWEPYPRRKPSHVAVQNAEIVARMERLLAEARTPPDAYLLPALDRHPECSPSPSS